MGRWLGFEEELVGEMAEAAVLVDGEWKKADVGAKEIGCDGPVELGSSSFVVFLRCAVRDVGVGGKTGGWWRARCVWHMGNCDVDGEVGWLLWVGRIGWCKGEFRPGARKAQPIFSLK